MRIQPAFLLPLTENLTLLENEIKSIEIENGVSLSLKFDDQPSLNYHLEGSSGLIPLIGH